MGFILTLILISVVIATISLFVSKGKNAVANSTTALITCLIISSVLIVFTWAISYSNMIRMQEKAVIIEQYKEAVELYAEKGVAEFKPGSGKATEFTDLKYNNYQTQVGEMIRELRDAIAKYNKMYISKKIMKNSIYWNWCIIMPEDSKLLKMGDFLK
jgi:hypothetical protein